MSFSHSLKERAADIWEDCYRHPFLQKMGQGTLPREIFRFYMLQDYVYLLSYAKVFAMGVLKSEEEWLMSRFAAMQDGILNGEMNLHREYMAALGITKEEMEAAKPSLYNRAYSANMLTVGQSGGAAEIIAAVLPCAWSYGEYGKRLVRDYAGQNANFYQPWIESYSSKEYEDSYQWMFDGLNRICEGQSDKRLEHIADIFIASMEFEYLFWDMAYNRQTSYLCDLKG